MTNIDLSSNVNKYYILNPLEMRNKMLVLWIDFELSVTKYYWRFYDYPSFFCMHM